MTKQRSTPNKNFVMAPTILIAGIGNIFLGDDGFGSEVARRLVGRSWPEGVRVVDYGIRGFDVAFALMDGCDVAILIDATPQGGSPGTLYVIEPDLAELNDPRVTELPIDTHAMNPMKVFQLVGAMNGRFNKVLIVGCEPGDFGPENEGRIGLSPPVAAAVDEAVSLIDKLIPKILSGNFFDPPHSVATSARVPNESSGAAAGEGR
jgi:hydrogenase maturation protease